MKKRFGFRRGQKVSCNNHKSSEFSSNNDSNIMKSSYLYKLVLNRILLGCVLISIGILLAESGGSWDITNHLLNKPETFFSLPHIILYSGIILAIIGATIMLLHWRSYSTYVSSQRGEKNLELDLSIKLVITGVTMLILAGPLDFFWHSAFGLDGLLSPPHLILTIGMFAASIGGLIGLRTFIFINNSISQDKRQNNDIDNLKNNEKNSISQYTTLTIIAIVTMMIPNKSLIPTIPFYVLNLIPIIIADIFLSRLPLKRMFIYTSGGILGSYFFMLYYTMITNIYNEVLSNQSVWPSLTAQIYFDMITQIYPLVVLPAVGVGILGTIISNR